MSEMFEYLISDLKKTIKKREARIIVIDGDDNEARSTACLSIIEKIYEMFDKKLTEMEMDDVCTFTLMEAFQIMHKYFNTDRKKQPLVLMNSILGSCNNRSLATLQEIIKNVRISIDFSPIFIVNLMDRQYIQQLYLANADYLIYVKGLVNENDHVEGIFRKRFRDERDIAFLHPDIIKEYKRYSEDSKHRKMLLNKDGARIIFPRARTSLKKKYDEFETYFLNEALSSFGMRHHLVIESPEFNPDKDKKEEIKE